MQTPNPRRIALLGVVVAALAAVAVLRPALEAFGYGQLNWAGVAYAAIPWALLWVSGYRHYGPVLAGVLATVITGLAVLAAGVLFVLALGLSLSGSGSGAVFLALLWVAPPAIILVLGLVSAWFVRRRPRAAD
ncbi:hypothetical protein [[Mycobacterium] wendilense]|uniref:Integral membrane protein n=1 Tax=[Mycobacterium] wendilense TaxID=3064284 RepID=A0ABM9MH11_9MYCO|nr:hypothetical protein [Mycolicibacterium sp. MU0050]CAJ1584961.1 hypothetical protein MU0050_003463 [Mycolicibacterium sp. MU0050]